MDLKVRCYTSLKFDIILWQTVFNLQIFNSYHIIHLAQFRSNTSNQSKYQKLRWRSRIEVTATFCFLCPGGSEAGVSTFSMMCRFSQPTPLLLTIENAKVCLIGKLMDLQTFLVAHNILALL